MISLCPFLKYMLKWIRNLQGKSPISESKYIKIRSNLTNYYNNCLNLEKMYQRCKKNVLKQFEAIRNLPKNVQAKSTVLILDMMTAPIMSDLISMQQLLQIGVKDLCRIDRIKKPQPTALAIYYISCASLKDLYKDFSSTRLIRDKEKDEDHSESQDHEPSGSQTQTQSLYYSINLLLCQQASKEVLHEISQHEQIIDKLASFGELYIPCKFTGSNIGIIPVSKTTQAYIESLRKISKIEPAPKSPNQTQSTMMPTKEDTTSLQQQKQRKREHTAHYIHKDNLSCLSDLYSYELEKGKNPKQLHNCERIERELEEYGRRLGQSVIAGANLGLSTLVKLVYYDSKFTNRVKESLIKYINEFLQSKIQQLQQAQLDQSINGQKGSLFRQQSGQAQSKEITIILADRQMDNLTPLIRSFYYQPLLMDIFEIRDPPDRNIKIVSKKIKPTVLECSDRIFGDYRNMFISDVFQKINPHLQEYIAKNKAAKFHKESIQKSKSKDDSIQIQLKQQTKTDAKQLKQVMKQLPEYKKTIKSYNTNTEILNVMGAIIKQRNLYEEAQLEHLIVTGYAGDKKQVKDKKILEKLLIFLEDPNLIVEDKCRLLVLAVCCLDIDNGERSKLITRLSKIEGHGDIALGLSKISSKGIKKYPLPAWVQKSPKEAYIDRHQATLSTLLDNLLHTPNSPPKLKSFKLEQLKPPPSALKPTVKSSLLKQKQRSVEYVISMCGGLGYNEISDMERTFRTATQQGNGNGGANVQVGISFVTDYIFTPGQYLEQLCTLL